MAIVDNGRDEVVIRIVYDGPPLAGKTTSLRALGAMLAASRRSDVFTPGEAQGRTLFFDWMDYLGGWWDGRQVRCQLVTVPGQESLGERRRLLLRDADVVILVAEATESGCAAASSRHAELRRALGEPHGVAVPVVLQANKQDLPNALSVDAIRARLPSDGLLATVGSSATEGSGVREAFALAVRLALDRVRELSKRGLLPLGEASIHSGDELLAWLEQQEGSGTPATRAEPSSSPVSRAPQPARAAAAARSEAGPRRVRSSEPAAPVAPDSRAPSGLVWPPMAGRVVLQELDGLPMRCVRATDGSWIGVAGERWRLLSRGPDAYPEMEAGRHRLLEAARTHASLLPLISERRALVLADARNGSWRLWHVVRIERSLEDALEDALDSPAPAEVASGIFEVADALVTAWTRFRTAQPPLPARLRTVGAKSLGHCYIGIVPAATASPSAAAPDPDASGLVRRELGPPLAAPRERRLDAARTLQRLRETLRERPDRADVIETLAALVIGH